jgi:hypothetical protein
MKKLLFILALITVAILFTCPTQVFAQADIVDVDPLPPGNINEVINGDTLAGGIRAHPDRVYRLTRGSVYQVTEPLNINGSLNIIATDGTDRPPVLAPAILSDNSSIDHFFDFVGKGGNVELNDLYFLSVRADDNVLGWSDGMRIFADSMSLKMKGCIWDGFTHTAIHLHSWWTKMLVQDCVFRNEMHGTSWFGGGAFLSDGGPAMDTCIWVNNTFFCNNSYLWSIRGYDRFSVFDHNTVVYSTVNPFLMRQASNVHMNNNLFYAVHAMGGNPTHVIDGWFLNYPDTASSSIVRFRGTDSVSYWSKLWDGTITGPEAYEDVGHGVTAAMLDKSLRVIDVQNNAYFWPQKLLNFYTAYNDTAQRKDSIWVPVYGQGEPADPNAYITRTLRIPTWMSDYTIYTLDTLLAGISNISVSNNVEEDPGFNSDVMNQVDNLIDYVQKITTDLLDVPWYYDPSGSGDLYPPAWPLNEDLSYSNTTMQSAGTDGFALGDLNWFPDQKAEWLLGVEKTSSNIPTEFSLSDAYPNPFNPETKINFNISKNSNVRIIVYNLLGQKVKTLFDKEFGAGSYTATWNGVDESGRHVASGVYLFSLESGAYKITKKVMLLK